MQVAVSEKALDLIAVFVCDCSMAVPHTFNPLTLVPGRSGKAKRAFSVAPATTQRSHVLLNSVQRINTCHEHLVGIATVHVRNEDLPSMPMPLSVLPLRKQEHVVTKCPP